MKLRDIGLAWGKILRGQKPLLSLEITRECPLRCPGCYAYEPSHLQSIGSLRELGDYKGDDLIAGVLALVRRLRPIHLSIVGGEPLVRYRELGVLLPKFADMNIEVQLVTSAVRLISLEWQNCRGLHLVVSVDGLQPEHDQRRSPATYERILKHIAGHRITVHCTITRPQLQRPDYLCDFAGFWSAREEVQNIWFSLFTPQDGEQSRERLGPEDRQFALARLTELRSRFPKVDLPDPVLRGYHRPPASPQECVFAQVTNCISSDLTTRITPCQFGGRPVCSECGCMASAGLTAIGRHKLGKLIPVSMIFDASRKLGEHYSRRLS